MNDNNGNSDNSGNYGFKAPNKTGEKMIAGVCSWIGAALKIDPTIIRVAFGVAVLFFPYLILVYFVALLFVPVPPNPEGERVRETALSRIVLLCGVAVSVIVVIAIIKHFYPDLDIRWNVVASFGVFCGGVSLFFDGVYLRKRSLGLSGSKIILGVIMFVLGVIMIFSSFQIGVLDTSRILNALLYEWPLLLLAIILNLVVSRKRFALIMWVSIMFFTLFLALLDSVVGFLPG